MVLTIVNLKGQIVYRNNLEILSHGERRIEVDLSALKSGIYNSQLWDHGDVIATRKLVIIR